MKSQISAVNSVGIILSFSLSVCVLSAGGDMSNSFELSSEEELNSMHANRKRSSKPDIASTYFDQRITVPRDGEEADVSFLFLFCFCIMV